MPSDYQEVNRIECRLLIPILLLCATAVQVDSMHSKSINLSLYYASTYLSLRTVP